MRRAKKNKFLMALLLLPLTAMTQQASITIDTAQYVSSQGNPIFPGYFADPYEFYDKDTFYIYSTTDGYNTGNFTNGPFTVWKSNDFANWTVKTLDYPSNFPYRNDRLWAPTIAKAANGRYYMYYIKSGYNCFVVSSATPEGPWRVENGGNPVWPDMFDTQFFKDRNGDNYLVFMGPNVNNKRAVYIGKLDSNMTSLASKPKVIYQNQDLFEAPGLFKRDGRYYLTYSSGSLSGSYNVRAASCDSVDGKYVPNIPNRILQSDNNRHIIATGSNTVLKFGNNYYIVYHRQAYPYRGDLFRQICADKMSFSKDGNIKEITPTDSGVNIAGLKKPLIVPDLAFEKPAAASSSEGNDYSPKDAFDHNNATLWRSKENIYPQWLEVDLGSSISISSVEIYFEYFTENYQYSLEYSNNNTDWNTYVGNSNSGLEGPVTVSKKVKARYVRLTIEGSSKTNQSTGVWGFKIH